MAPNEGNNHRFDVALACEVGVEKALLLGNISFWVNQNAQKQSQKHFRNGRYWTYDTASGLTNKYPYLHSKSIARWLSELEAGKWIVKGRFNEKNIDKTLWYTIGERLEFFYNSSISQNEKSGNGTEENSISQNEESNENSISQNKKSELPISQNEESGEIEKTPNSQNEKMEELKKNPISQNEESSKTPISQNKKSELSISQNENSISQNEKSASIYKDTDINSTDINPDVNINKYPAGEIDFSQNEKNETPPPPTPAPEIIDPPPKPVSVEEPPDEDLKVLEEYTQKLKNHRPLRESLTRLYRQQYGLDEEKALIYIERFVIREWGIENLKDRPRKEVIGHCQRWIANELRIEKENAEKVNRNGSYGKNTANRYGSKTTALTATFDPGRSLQDEDF